MNSWEHRVPARQTLVQMQASRLQAVWLWASYLIPLSLISLSIRQISVLGVGRVSVKTKWGNSWKAPNRMNGKAVTKCPFKTNLLNRRARCVFLRSSAGRLCSWKNFLEASGWGSTPGHDTNTSQVPVEELFEFCPNVFPINCPKSHVS